MKDCTCSNFSINTFLHLNNDHLLSQIDMFEKGGKIIIFHKSLHVQNICKIFKAFFKSIFKWNQFLFLEFLLSKVTWYLPNQYWLSV